MPIVLNKSVYASTWVELARCNTIEDATSVRQAFTDVVTGCTCLLKHLQQLCESNFICIHGSEDASKSVSAMRYNADEMAKSLLHSDLYVQCSYTASADESGESHQAFSVYAYRPVIDYIGKCAQEITLLVNKFAELYNKGECDLKLRYNIERLVDTYNRLEIRIQNFNAKVQHPILLAK